MTPERARKIRTDYGLGTSAMAKVLGLADHHTVSRYERGKHPISGPVQVLLTLIEQGVWKP